jgi:Tol biopolymer transport system component
MVTGARPFAGDTPASVIGAILKDTPPALSSRQPLAPRALDHLVARCLAKDPEERWQTSGDVGKVLESIAAIDTADADRRARPARAWRERAAWIATTAALAGALVFVVWGRPPEPAREVVRLSVNAPAGTAFSSWVGMTVPVPTFAVSPDGRSLAMVAAAPGRPAGLWVRSLQDPDARMLPGTDDAQDPIFWSPDSAWIGFADSRGNLKKIAVSSGTVQTIMNSGAADARGASWSPDDTILFGSAFGPVHRVPAAGGTPTAVTELDRSKQEGSHRFPNPLPDGRHFLFNVRSGLEGQRGLYVGSLNDGSKRRLLPGDSIDARYVAGHVLYLDGDTLVARVLDLERLELSGSPIPIAAGVGRSTRGDGAYSAAAAGILAHSPATLQPGRLTWFDRRGTPLGTAGLDGEHDYADFRLSPDDSRLASSLVDPKVVLPDIWTTDFARGGNSRLTFGPSMNNAPVWSPTGDQIAFRTNHKGLNEIYLRSAMAGGEERPVLLEEVARASGVNVGTLSLSDWSTGGYLAFSSGAPSDIWVVPVADPGKPVRLVGSQGSQMHANFSPDGRFIAYTSNESGRYEVFVETAPVSGGKWPVSTNGGYEPRWRADGRELYYLSEDRVLMAVPVSSGANPFGVPSPLFQTQVHPGVSMLRTHYVPSRDGRRFLIHARSGETPPSVITVVLNWTAQLAR